MNIETFKRICKVHNQYALKKVLKEMLKRYYSTVIDEDGFLYVPSVNVDVMLTAHMDTVHPNKCKKIVEVERDGKKALWSPQGIGGDDRCGVFMICELLKTTEFRPSIVFCEDEEIGGRGSDKFANWLKNHDECTNIKYIIELDRKNATDAVFYDCGNDEFKDYITKTIGYKEAIGSFSDIGNISPVLDVASVNLSCGYYKEHTLEHYVVVSEMEHTFEVLKYLLDDSVNVDKFDYQEIEWYPSNYYGYNYGYGYGGGLQQWAEEYMIVAIKNGTQITEIYEGTYESCVGQFLMEHNDITYSEVYFVGDPYDYDDLEGYNY